MECSQYKERLNPYLDVELSPEESRAVEDHLKTCGSCVAEMQVQQRLKRELRMAGKRYAPSLEFRRRIEAQSVPPQKTKWLSGWLPQVALAALALVVLLTAWDQIRHRPDGPIVAELVDVHVTTLASASPVDVVSTDRHTVKPWFQGKIPFTFNIPELQGSAFTLLGGRVSYLQQQPAAQLLFEIRKHKVSVFVQQDRPEHRASFSGGENYSAFTIRSWKNGGLQYFLISDANSEDADSLVQIFKRTP